MNDEGNAPRQTSGRLFTRDFIIGFLSLFVFLAADRSLAPTLPIFFTRLGSNESEIGVLIGICAAASLVSRLFVGGALLKYQARSIMMLGALISAIAFLASIAFRPFWPFAIIRFLQGVALACIDTAAFASIVNTTPLAYRTRALGYVMLAPSLSLAIAAPIGVFTINHYGSTVYFFSCAVLTLCALFLAWAVKGQEAVAAKKAGSFHFSSFVNLKILTPAVVTFLELFVWGSVAAFFPLYAIQCGVTNPGHFFSAMGIVMVACRMFGGKIMDNCDKEKLIVTFLLALIVMLIVLAFSKTLPMFIIVGAVWGIGAAFFVPVAMAYALEYSGSSDGASVGTIRAIFDLGLALGPVVTGMIIPLTGYRIMFLFLAFICLVNVSHFHFYVRKRRMGRL
ncbi:MAG TPA: MFS transporter [Syntrophorhabdaceae bacterium]|nr:MFS transporter [Syntrophorhabdaceae bacterium]